MRPGGLVYCLAMALGVLCIACDDRFGNEIQGHSPALPVSPTVGRAASVCERGVTGDFTGDGRADLAAYVPQTGSWHIRSNPEDITFGGPGQIPVPGDYDGDRSTNIATYVPATGLWHIRISAEETLTFTFGGPGQIPVPGDYNGDCSTEIATYVPATGLWHISTLGTFTFGGPGQIPVPGDYDGNGTTDIATYVPETGLWHIKDQGTFTFGGPGQIPVPADYDGNGSTDIATYVPADGQWFTSTRGMFTFGGPGQFPVPAAYDNVPGADIATYVTVRSLWHLEGGLTFRLTRDDEGPYVPITGPTPFPDSFYEPEPASTPPLAAPTGLSILVGSNEVTASWIDNSVEEESYWVWLLDKESKPDNEFWSASHVVEASAGTGRIPISIPGAVSLPYCLSVEAVGSGHAISVGPTFCRPQYIILHSAADPPAQNYPDEMLADIGPGSVRRLGFMVDVSFFETECSIATKLEQAFHKAECLNMPLVVHAYGEAPGNDPGWEARPDLWNWFDPTQPGFADANRYNVEWSYWNEPTTRSFVLWGSPVERKPRPCFESALIRNEVLQKGEFIATRVKNWLDQLNDAGRGELLAGVVTGWETGIESLVGIPGVPPEDQQHLGYCELATRGYTEQDPPFNIETSLAETVQGYVYLQAQAISSHGVPTQLIHSHVIGGEGFTRPDPWPPVHAHAPLWVIDNNYSQPGLSLYPNNYNPADVDNEVAGKRWAVSEAPWDAQEVTCLAQKPGLNFLVIYNWDGVGGVRNPNDGGPNDGGPDDYYSAIQDLLDGATADCSAED